MSSGDPVERWRSARRDPGRAVLEGFHPLKHALRFGAEILEAAAPDPGAVVDLAASLAPDVRDHVAEVVESVEPSIFDRLVPRPPASGVVAMARRPTVETREVLGDPAPAPVIFLDRPRRMGNIGAVVRVAAAAEAAGVLSSGPHDPWNPAAIRGAAGLHFALPVARVDALPDTDRPVVAVDPEGEPLEPGSIPPRALLAFGTERHGLSRSLLGRARRRVAIPMRSGVSSLNLATAVAVVLYVGREGFALEPGGGDRDIGADPG
ncbi:MAG: TrmH family RNA methyltransferase [Gemmatimonadota bacterium]|nr:TrmH family RNA methyltransferase [Gemmatimonadota bacterium]